MKDATSHWSPVYIILIGPIIILKRENIQVVLLEKKNRREQSVALSCCLGGAEKILSKQKQESRNSLCSRKHFPDTETFPDMRDGSQARVDECKNISFCCTGKDPEWNNIIYRFLWNLECKCIFVALTTDCLSHDPTVSIALCLPAAAILALVDFANGANGVMVSIPGEYLLAPRADDNTKNKSFS